MPRKYKRKYYKKKDNYTVGGSIAHLAKKAMQTAKYVKSLVNVEYKRLDGAVIPTNLDYGGVVGNFHTIAQGTTAITRTGDSIKVTSIDLGITVSQSTTQTIPIMCRLMIVKGHSEIGTSPTGALLLQSSGTYQCINSPRNVDYTKSYTVLWERRFNMSPSTSSDTGKKFFSVFLPINDHIKYQTGTTTVEDGGLYYVFFCDQVAAATVPNFTMYYRTRFIDN